MGGVDLSEFHLALDRLRAQLCHCANQGECLGCKGVELLRNQGEAVVAAASQPVLLQVAQEASYRDMANQFEAMADRLMNDPSLRQAAERMQEQVLSDPETRALLEELMRRMQPPPSAPPASPPGEG